MPLLGVLGLLDRGIENQAFYAKNGSTVVRYSVFSVTLYGMTVPNSRARSRISSREAEVVEYGQG